MCRLRSIAAHRDHFVRYLSACVYVCVCVSGSHTFFIVSIPRNAATVLFNILNIRNDSAEARACHVVSVYNLILARYDLVVPRSDVLATRLNNTDRNYNIFSRNYCLSENNEIR